MKKLLLIIATYMLFTSVQEIHAENFYTGLTGGLNWLEESKYPNLDVDLDVGPTFAGVIGHRCDCGFRVEGELSYRFNRIAKVKFNQGNVHMHGHVRTWSTMANVLYNFPVDFFVQPYIGAGIGYAKSSIHLKHKPTGLTDKTTAEGFTHQLIAGIEYPLNDNLALDTKYRYQKTHHMVHNQSVELGLVYAF